MMTLHCLIIDDEPLALDLMEDNIRRVPFLKMVAKCKNALEAINILHNVHIDLVFTDIQMPGLNGLQLVETLQTRPMFIFVTAYEKFAVDGYKYDVIDYLLKPVAFDRFLQACNKALSRYSVIRSQELGNSSYNVVDATPKHIFVHVDYSLVKVLLNDVKFIEAERDYIRIHFASGKRSLLMRLSMKGIEELLPSGRFLRTHKSFIINAGMVTAIRKNSVFIDEREFAVSDPYKEVITLLSSGRI